MQCGKVDEMVKFIDEVLSSDKFICPPDAYFYVMAADFYLNTMQGDKAIDLLKKALDLDPYFDKAHFLKITAEIATDGKQIAKIKESTNNFMQNCPSSPLLSESLQYLHLQNLNQLFPSVTKTSAS